MACSSASSTRTPPPSPQTKPSRPASKGREAFVGSALRVDIAFIAQNPAIVSGMIIASEPPAIMTSASPRWMSLRASPIAWLPVGDALRLIQRGDADEPEGVADRVVAGRAGGDDCGVRPPQ